MVTAYSMKDKRWALLRIGRTDLAMGTHGCFVAAIAMLDGRPPDIVLKILNRNNAFTEKGELISDVAARALGLEYNGVAKKNPHELCIAESNCFAKLGFDKHFFVWLGDNLRRIIDPLDGQEKQNFYSIVSYRLFKKKKKKEVAAEEKKPDVALVAVEKKPNLWEIFLVWLKKVLTRSGV